jgi:hypothetical protein
MAYREVSGSTNTRDLKKEPVGTSVEGIYRGNRTFDTQFGEQIVFNFTGKDGSTFGVYGFTSLNRWMEGVAVGTLTRITYQGKTIVETKRGKVPMHQCKVEVDDDSLDPTRDGPPVTEESTA